MKRVVVTGIGIVSCLGNNQEEVYQSLKNSKSGIFDRGAWKRPVCEVITPLIIMIPGVGLVYMH